MHASPDTCSFAPAHVKEMIPVVSKPFSPSIGRYYTVAHCKAKDEALCAGKTTFIKHLLQRDYPGIHIGPEPTTDR